VTGAGCIIADCNVGANPSKGIDAGDGTTVRNCTVRGNNDGIEARNNCHILENTCSENTGYGIVSFSTGSRVEGNSCNLNGSYGFDLDSATATLFIRNSARGNGVGAFSLGSSTIAGPIIAPGVIIDSNSPWANFIY
jgi:parallel beta-helix repeat protein